MRILFFYRKIKLLRFLDKAENEISIWWFYVHALSCVALFHTCNGRVLEPKFTLANCNSCVVYPGYFQLGLVFVDST